jgi:hypothetical protein
MLNVKDWMKLVEYKITDGSRYSWNCYGPNSYVLDSWDGKYGDGDSAGGYSLSIIFSTKSQKVYEVSVCDYANNCAYRKINPKWAERHRTEAVSRATSYDQAWDDIDYIDLQDDEDFIQKAHSIRGGLLYQKYESI